MPEQVDQSRKYFLTQTATVAVPAKPPLLSGWSSDRPLRHQRRWAASVTMVTLICAVASVVLALLMYLR